MKEFLKMIVKSGEKKAKETNMTDEEKKEHITRRLFEYFERNNMDEISEDLVKEYEEVYPEFSKDYFVKYVISHTKNQKVIFNEKIKLEEKINKIEKEIYNNKRELGIGMIVQKGDKPKYLFEKIEQIQEKYKICANEDEKLNEEQIQENLDVIQQMINIYNNPEELHDIAKKQVGFFKGMGDDYQEILKEKSPEYKKYVEESLEKELRFYNNKKLEIENKLEELEQLKKGFEDCITNVYDTKLDEKYKGSKDEREHNKFLNHGTQER